MERLQEALKRAREKREQAGGPAAAPGAGLDGRGGGPGSGPGGGPGDGTAPPATALPDGARQSVWETLEEFVPVPRILRKNRIVSYFGGPEASSFDMMRTKIVQQAKTKEVRRILVTSPGPGCGKTTTTTNLAFSLARQADLRTIVIDIDLRRPNLGGVLGIQKAQQFSSVLAREADPLEHMSRIGPNLIVATNAVPVANPSELIQSQSAQDVLMEMERHFEPDFVLFDAPPVLTSDDAIGFLEHCDAALIVAAAEQSSIEELDVTEAEVAAVSTVLGVVLNKCRYTTTNYDYY